MINDHKKKAEKLTRANLTLDNYRAMGLEKDCMECIHGGPAVCPLRSMLIDDYIAKENAKNGEGK